MATRILPRRRADRMDPIPLGGSRNEAIGLLFAILVLVVIAAAFWLRATQ
jgi:hypothetical protein